MKTIGLIGGMSWESSLEYYRVINETVKARLGGLHSAQCVLVSIDFAGMEELQHEGRWEEAGRVLAEAAQNLERGGADCVVLCTNTMHKVAGAIQAAVQIPMLHIADATAERIQAQRIPVQRVGLLGTRFTLEEDFYRGRLERQFGLHVLVPDESDRAYVHQVIYDELCLGIIRPESRARYQAIMVRLVAAGAQGIILGCTEIGLLVASDDPAAPAPLFDTTRIHAEAAVAFALSGG